MLDDLVSVLRASLGRLESLDPGSRDSPIAELRLATQLHAHAGLVAALAAELEARAHEDLGRLGARLVELASRAPDPESAASEVAEGFLALGGRSA